MVLWFMDLYFSVIIMLKFLNDLLFFGNMQLFTSQEVN